MQPTDMCSNQENYGCTSEKINILHSHCTFLNGVYIILVLNYLGILKMMQCMFSGVGLPRPTANVFDQ